MKQIIGEFQTKYGTAQFRMDSAKSAVLMMSPNWTIHGVEYKGRIEVATLEDAQDPTYYESVEGWYEKREAVYIRRVDGKDINYHSAAVNKIRNEMLRAFATYITNAKNAGVLTIAAKIKLDNERDGLIATLDEQDKKLQIAKAALEQWDTARHSLYEALKMGAANAVVNPDVHVE